MVFYDAILYLFMDIIMSTRIIPESKIRSIIHGELKSYLIKEGLMDVLKTAGSDIKKTFKKARQRSVFRKSSTPGKLLADLKYLQVTNADGIATLADQLSTISGVKNPDVFTILDKLSDLINNKKTKQDQDLKLDEATTTPATDIEILTKLYRFSVSKEMNLFNALKGKKADDENFLQLKGQYIEYAICKMIIQNLINPALGTDILSDKQIETINSILNQIKIIFKTAMNKPEATSVEVPHKSDVGILSE
jgi:hypothetical protein